MKSIPLPVSVFSALVAVESFAHEGHGMTGSDHWHASDAWGLAAFAVVLGVACWRGRGK